MKRKLLLLFFYVFLGIISSAQTIQISVDVLQGQKSISPSIYGRNNSASQNPSKPVTAAQWQLLRDAGVKLLRENQGNNASKYNWRKKLSSHPDWYNNVETHNWDYTALEIQKNMPEIQQMWALPLVGYAAKDTSYNFDFMAYDGGKGGSNEENWCANGDASKYLEPWGPDSVVGILNYWLHDLKLNPNTIQYWNMDNEAEIWFAKHSDVILKTFEAENYIQNYIATAKKAKAIFPNIKLVGPAFSNEWQWYNWNGVKVTAADGRTYTWVEYFIKRIAEEQKASGVKLVDVLDFHLYPNSDPALTLQVHRIWFDTTWVYPNANGIKRLGSSDWNATQDKEYIFLRCKDWLNQYMGENNGVTMGVSEYGQIYKDDPNVVACWYASHLGTFADNNVELFTPWDWDLGMWEVMHLFTKYAGSIRVASTSSANDVVSAYSSLTAKGDSLTIILVNKDLNNSQTVSVNITNVSTKNGPVSVYSLSDLPKTETFVSATNNALKKSTVSLTNNTIQVTVPKLSTTAIVIKTNKPVAIKKN
jgi:hypothetical protein